MSTFYRLKKDIGEKVISTYEHKCSVCGSTEDLCVHHKIKMKPSDEKYNDTENLIVLCRKCHMSHHIKEKDIRKPIVLCSYENCDEKQHAKGLCKKHYRQAYPARNYSSKDLQTRHRCYAVAEKTQDKIKELSILACGKT